MQNLIPNPQSPIPFFLSAIPLPQFFRDAGENPFLLAGLAAGLLASLACGVIGPYVITRRIVFLSGAIAHVAVGGVGAALFLHAVLPWHFAWLRPIHGAMLAALLAAVLIGLLHQRAAERMDTLIGALWALGMAVGILLAKFTPGYNAELMSYLFGSITFVTWSDVGLMLGLDAAIVATVALFHKRLLAICLDEEQAELQGVRVLASNVVLLCLVALTVIALCQVVGLILVIALLSLPAATAAHHVQRMASLVVLSTVLCAAITTVPRVAVYGTRISPESAIVLAAAGVYLVSVLVQRVRGRVGGRR
jgi:zinc transport system permease protein